MRMQLDIGTTIDSGNITYHLWAISECSEIMGEFIQCGTYILFDIVHLLSDLDLDSNHQPLDHGKMTAVIRYRTPYFINKRDPLFIYSALGNDVFLRCILRFPTLLVLGGLVDLVKWEFVYSESNGTFPFTLDPPSKGLPESIVFDNITYIIPQTVSTNVKPNPSLLQYTSVEDRALHY